MAKERNEKRRRSRGGIVEILNAILTLVIIGMVVAVAGLLYAANQFYADGAVATDTSFTVERGSSISTVAARLEEQGLIPAGQLLPSTLLFRLGATALRLTKKRFRELSQPGFDAALVAAKEIQREAYRSGEPQAAMQKFFEARGKKG